MNDRPGDFTMAWECNFQIGAKKELITFLTDDFETVYAEYLRMKAANKEPVVFVSHELKTKARMLVSPEMMGIPEAVEPRVEPIINADQPIRGQAQRIRNAAARGDVPVMQLRAGEGWMGQHNRDLAKHMLREPPQDRI